MQMQMFPLTSRKYCAKLNVRVTEYGSAQAGFAVCKAALHIEENESSYRPVDTGDVRPDRWSEYALGCQALEAAIEWRRWRFAQELEKTEREDVTKWQDDGGGPETKTL